MKKIITILFFVTVLNGCAEYLQHVKDSSVTNQKEEVVDGQQIMQRVMPYEFTLNGHINPATGTYGGGLGGGF